MALKKPTDFFKKEELNIDIPVIKTDESLREELVKVEDLFEQVNQLQQELTQKVIKNDLESLVLSQINKMQENFKILQEEFSQSNQKDINEFNEKITELTIIVSDLIETEIPKYKKKITKNELFVGEKVHQLQQSVEENIIEIRQEIDSKFENIADVVDNNIQYFNSQLEETSSQVKKTTETYTNLSKIVESRISKENEQLEKYSQTIEDIQKGFNELQQSLIEKIFLSKEIIEEKFKEHQEQTEEKINHHQKEFKDTQIKLEHSVDNRLENYRQELVDVKADVVINEQHIKKIDNYLQEHHQELIELKEEVFDEIEKLPVGNLQENLERLERKIDFIKETYSRIEPEVIVKEVIKEGLLNEPPNVKNGDPLTPLNQNFVTLDQLQQHYRLFLNRIQQQLSTLGGGGETRLKYLDDIVGIATNASAYDGKYLRYNHSSGKFEFEVAQVTPDSIVLGTDTTGDYVQSISGTANQITVSGGTGESSTPVVSIAPNPLLPGNVTIANDLQVNNNLNVTGNLNSSGVNTATTISGTTATYTTGNFTTGNIVTGVVTSISGTNLNYSGVSTVGSLNIGATQVISSGRQLQNIASLDATTTATIESAIANAPNTFTDIQVTGVSTFTNGPVLIGSATSTGTATQRLQVTGGGYISGSIGIGTTNPTSTLQVSGTLYNSGIGTFANGNTTYGLSSASSLELGLNNNNNAGTLKIWGTTSNSYGLIQGTTSNLHIDCVGGGTFLNYYDGDFISFGNGASVESARFTGSTGVLTLGSITATGTASQRLQVTGGAYVSSNTGIGTTNPQALLSIGSVSGFQDTTTTLATTTATTIDSFSATIFRSARIQVQISQSTNYQASDVLVIHDGTTASIVEYGSIATNDYLGTLNATVSGGNCLLRVAMGSATSATVKVLSQRITI